MTKPQKPTDEEWDRFISAEENIRVSKPDPVKASPANSARLGRIEKFPTLVSLAESGTAAAQSLHRLMVFAAILVPVIYCGSCFLSFAASKGDPMILGVSIVGFVPVVGSAILTYAISRLVNLTLLGAIESSRVLLEIEKNTRK